MKNNPEIINNSDQLTSSNQELTNNSEKLESDVQNLRTSPERLVSIDQKLATHSEKPAFDAQELATNPDKSTSVAQEWNEDALAQLVGLENKSRIENPNYLEKNNNLNSINRTDSLNAINQADLFDEPQELNSDPYKNTTTRNLAKKPLPKLALVAVGLLVVFGIGGLTLNSMMKVKVSSKAPKVQDSAKTSIVEKKAEIENKEGELKTQLAISKQADDLKAIDEKSKDKKKQGVKPEKDKKGATASSTSLKTANSSPPQPPAPVAYVPPPVRTPAPVAYNPPTPEPLPSRVPTPEPLPSRGEPSVLPKPLPVPSSPSSGSPISTLNQQPIKQTDPLEQWNKLKRVGSYGRISLSDEAPLLSVSSNSGENRPNPNSQTSSQTKQASASNSISPQLSSQTKQASTSNSINPQPLSQTKQASTSVGERQTIQTVQQPPDPRLPDTEAENRVLQGIPIKRLVPGATAAARLATSLVWSEDSQGEQRFVVALKEPLLGVDGVEALPVGQQIVFNLSGVSSNGLVTATAISTIDNQGVERSLPPDALTLQADKKKPLLAKGLFDHGKAIAGMDMGIAALGAVSKVGEILNRPKQQSSSSSTGSETSTTTTSIRGNPNLLGALMEGGATPVLESIQKRNQTAIETLSEQKNAWFLPAGESAQIVVSQLFELYFKLSCI